MLQRILGPKPYKAVAETPVITDRRAHPRGDCSLVVKCWSRTGLRWRGLAIDISPVGVCVVFWSKMGPPEVATICFLDDQRKEIRLPARQVHFRRQGNFWLVGCAFERKMTHDEFAALI